MSSSCQVTGEKYCGHDRCWKEWLEELEGLEEDNTMTMDEVTRLIDRLVDRVKYLETELNLQEDRIYELERDQRQLFSRIQELEDGN